MEIRLEKKEVADIVTWALTSEESPFYLGVGSMEIVESKMLTGGEVRVVLQAANHQGGENDDDDE